MAQESKKAVGFEELVSEIREMKAENRALREAINQIIEQLRIFKLNFQQTALNQQAMMSRR